MKESSATEPATWNVEAQPFLKSILDAVAQPVWVVDHDGFIRFANPAALAALGYDDLSELEGKPSHEMIHYQYPDGSHFPVEKCPLLLPLKAGQTIHSDEDWFFRRDGTSFAVSYWSAPIETPQGRGAVVAFTDIEERRQIEQVLRERDAVLASIEQPVYVGDDEGVIQYANPAAVRALGYEDVSELIGKEGHWLVHYKRPDGSHFPIEECPLSGVRVIGETLRVDEDWWVRKDGSMIQIAYSAVPIQTPNGFGIAIAFTDVTEPRRVEQVLRERDVILTTFDQPVYLSEGGVFKYVNPAGVRTLGYEDAAELEGQMGHWLVHYKHPDGSHYPIEECPLQKARLTGETIHDAEDWWVRKDGSMIPISYSATPTETESGAGTIVAFRDISERKRAEEALRSSEEQLREILKGAHEAFVSMDSTGLIRAWNPEAEVTFGWTESEAIGRVLADTIIPPRYREEHRAGLERFLATGQYRLLNRRIEIEAFHRDGHEFPVELTISAVQVGDGYEFNAFLHDISGRRSAELNAREREVAEARAAEARAAQRRIIEAADAARRQVARDLHDGAQQQFVNVAINLQRAQQKWTPEPDAARELLETATQQARDGIDELRELAAGIHPSLLTTRGLLAAVEALADRIPILVEPLEIPEQRFPPAIEASVYFLVCEALTNVVKHARATRAGVRIAAAGQLTVEVRDDGVGGVEAHAPGQGLAGMADRMEALDGTFTIRSEASAGTTLRAEIPLPESDLSP
jgi:PAS domain S-box-containing protein